jgi:hypothetical protein
MQECIGIHHVYHGGALTVCDTFLSCCLKVMPVTQQRCLHRCLQVLEAEFVDALFGFAKANILRMHNTSSIHSDYT